MRRRAPFVKMPGDGRSRFTDTELTQSFDYGTASPRPTRRQIVNAAAQAAGLPGSGAVTGALCCGDSLTGGGTGVGAGATTTGPGSTAVLSAKVAGLKSSMATTNQTLTQQVTFNSDVSTLLTDLYTQTGYTSPIPIPTDPGAGSGI